METTVLSLKGVKMAKFIRVSPIDAIGSVYLNVDEIKAFSATKESDGKELTFIWCNDRPFKVTEKISEILQQISGD